MQRVEPVVVEVVDDLPDRVGLVELTFAIWATSMPCTDNNTI
jgi:hypothetical protein